MKESEVDETNAKLSDISIKLKKKTGGQKQKQLLSDCSSSVTLSESTNSDSSIQSTPLTQVKKYLNFEMNISVKYFYSP